ncbi:hypothetical protein HQ395_20415 [Aeromonas hydrophila]|uniref:hypothetical protein n=1 Tax=Aeromonas hydrophila TaxID=644 RepID=UPI001C054701|nr:hypothetical protein [Aeromonas hydrophila]QWL80930.1 hypothetical protein HQ395_20415 [Aeromonas hydrophila]
MKVETVKFDFGSPYSTPANMIATLAEHQDRADALIGQTAEKMNQQLIALREKLMGEIPKPNIAGFRAELEKAREAAQARLSAGVAAASAGVSEVDHLTFVVALQSRVIGGVSLEQLLAELGDYKALNSLATLAEQLGRTGIAAEARAKAIDIATNGAQREIDQLSGCLLDLVNAEANYHARWQKMLGQLGKGAEE